MDDFDTDLDLDTDFDASDEEDDAAEFAAIHGLTLTDEDVEALCDYLDCEDADVDAEIVDCMDREGCGALMVLVAAHAAQATPAEQDDAKASAAKVAALKRLFGRQ